MNKLIEAEIKDYLRRSDVENYPRDKYSCIEKGTDTLLDETHYIESPYELCPDKVQEFLTQALHRFEKALREKILSELPAEKTKLLPDRKPEGVNVRSWARKADRRHGFNDCLSQVKNIIKPESL